jgi:hypothetical protein
MATALEAVKNVLVLCIDSEVDNAKIGNIIVLLNFAYNCTSHSIRLSPFRAS